MNDKYFIKKKKTLYIFSIFYFVPVFRGRYSHVMKQHLQSCTNKKIKK